MFSNTITLTINAVDRVMTRVNQDNYGSEYQFRSGTEKLNMKIRHSVDSTGGQKFNRHNVYTEWTIFATPTTLQRVFTYTFTVRELEGSDPEDLEDLALGVNALLTALVSGIVIGEN